MTLDGKAKVGMMSSKRLSLLSHPKRACMCKVAVYQVCEQLWHPLALTITNSRNCRRNGSSKGSNSQQCSSQRYNSCYPAPGHKLPAPPNPDFPWILHWSLAKSRVQ
jgi:hypothetical protein